jgi:hypothetical protein
MAGEGRSSTSSLCAGGKKRGWSAFAGHDDGGVAIKKRKKKYFARSAVSASSVNSARNLL